MVYWEAENERTKAEQAQWIRDNPEEWAKMQEKSRQRHDEMMKNRKQKQE
jgi:hypothetical protein